MLSVSLRNLSFIKAEWSSFPHRHVAYRKALTTAFLILPLKRGGRGPKQEMLTSVFFLQYESAMERMQKSKLSHYKKTMEVSKEVLCRFLDANWLQFETGWNLYVVYLYLKKDQECVSVQEHVREDVIPTTRRKLIFPATPAEESPKQIPRKLMCNEQCPRPNRISFFLGKNTYGSKCNFSVCVNTILKPVRESCKQETSPTGKFAGTGTAGSWFWFPVGNCL